MVHPYEYNSLSCKLCCFFVGKFTCEWCGWLSSVVSHYKWEQWVVNIIYRNRLNLKEYIETYCLAKKK